MLERFGTHWARFALFGTFAVAAGCAGRATTPAEDEPFVEEQAAAPASTEEQARGPGKRGPELLLRAALEHLDLSAEQRTAIESVQRDLRSADHAQAKSVFATLAAGVRAGKLDDAAIATGLDAAEKSSTDQRAKVVAALQKLHDTLTPEQRSTLVAAIEKRAAERMGDRDGKAHGARGKHGKDGARGPLARLLRGVDLSDEQRERVHQALADAGALEMHGKGTKASKTEMRAKGKAMLDAFAKDRFDAAALVPERASARGKLETVVKAVKAVVPILDASQRGTLADNLERGPKHRGGKRGPGGERGQKG